MRRQNSLRRWDLHLHLFLLFNKLEELELPHALFFHELGGLQNNFHSIQTRQMLIFLYHTVARNFLTNFIIVLMVLRFTFSDFAAAVAVMSSQNVKIICFTFGGLRRLYFRDLSLRTWRIFVKSPIKFRKHPLVIGRSPDEWYPPLTQAIILRVC
jgi:hypothetical protein